MGSYLDFNIVERVMMTLLGKGCRESARGHRGAWKMVGVIYLRKERKVLLTEIVTVLNSGGEGPRMHRTQAKPLRNSPSPLTFFHITSKRSITEYFNWL